MLFGLGADALIALGAAWVAIRVGIVFAVLRRRGHLQGLAPGSE